MIEIAPEDMPYVWALVGHVAALALALLAMALKWNGLAALLAWLVTLGSLLLGVLWFLMLGGGRKNTHADESVALALDPKGGLWVTLYIVVTLILGYLITRVVNKRTNTPRVVSSAP